MAINIKKLESDKIIQTDNSILTPLYGQIKIGQNVDLSQYTYFDTIDGYDLFVNENGEDTIAIKAESISEDTNTNFIDTEIKNIQNKYNVSTVKFDEGTSSIIVQAKKDNESVIDEICKEYKNKPNYDVSRATNWAVFIGVPSIETKLEDDDLLNKLDDQSIKSLASKTGTKLSGSESKDELKGIIKGALSKSK